MVDDDTAVEMFVGGLVLDPNTQAPVVVLKDETGDVHLPIWIGIAEATSIASAIKDLNMARPLTHDLMIDIFSELGVRVQRVVITELKDSTYYAELILSSGDKAIIMDSRPSDAIGIALRASAPIFVANQVLEQAQITFNEQSETSSAATDAADAAAESGEPMSEELQQQIDVAEQVNPSKDFKDIDKTKWEKMLEELEIDDFKYKM
jgi:bifunctional DNase/RNase